MSCNKVQPKLSAYLDGEMSGVEMMQFRTHINDCRTCQSELNGLRAVHSMMRDLPAGPEPSEQLADKVMMRVNASRPNFMRLALVVAVPVLCYAIFTFSRPNQAKIPNRDLILKSQLAQDQIFDAGSDPTSGASLVHYTNFEGR